MLAERTHLIELQRRVWELAASQAEWMPWNCRLTLAGTGMCLIDKD
ncbi:MAG: hypothetical protein ABFD60_17255 [Bryobacteraceae bacterium]